MNISSGTNEFIPMREHAEAVAKQTGISDAQAPIFLQKVLAGIADALVQQGKIKLGDFGTFQVKLRKARKGRNPRTGAKLTIPAKLRASFKPGRELNARLDQLKQNPGSS